MNILVTGAHGFIGSNMVSFLKDRGHFVIATDYMHNGFRKDFWIKADMDIVTDLRNIVEVHRLFSHSYEIDKIDLVLHFASDMGGVGYFTANDYYPYINNMQMDMNMLKAVEKYSKEVSNKIRLFYSSSACIYPIHKQMEEGNAPKLKETDIYPANSDLSYGWEKLMMLRLCERAPIDARVGIFHTIFGPYQEMEGERMKMPTAIATKAIKAIDTGEMEVWGNGKQIRSFCYIQDAMEKIYSIATDDNYLGPVNVGSDEAVTVDQIVKVCCDYLGINPRITHTMDKPSGVLARNCDNTLFEERYGFKNKYSTAEGFQNLIDFIRSRPSLS